MCQVCAHGKKKSERRVPIAATTIPQAVAKEPGTASIKIKVRAASPPNEPLPQKQHIPNIRCNSFDWLAEI
jgi:hypothetical protein